MILLGSCESKRKLVFVLVSLVDSIQSVFHEHEGGSRALGSSALRLAKPIAEEVVARDIHFGRRCTNGDFSELR